MMGKDCADDRAVNILLETSPGQNPRKLFLYLSKIRRRTHLNYGIITLDESKKHNIRVDME